ncbi:ribokinase [Pseudaestuariivita rosea]|uniref:ribokinase n=1 Tax=Pseudaestuariivita rosea TaxID=2763263 RepID=UPI001ABBB20B|nr:ribokinase [Pseudaestuariivita rosea]
MTIYNLGSINIDHFYQVPHLVKPGETLAAESYHVGLGGKGTNQSVAAARAASQVLHIGSIGHDAIWIKDRMTQYGVDVSHVRETDTPTGHAIIQVDDAGENSITIFAGANANQSTQHIKRALDTAGSDDTLLLQNETSHQVEAAQIALERGMRVIYSAAPFDADSVMAVLPFVTMLAVNRIEMQQLTDQFQQIDVPQKLVTLGSDGAYWTDNKTKINAPAFKVKAVDTTGAGDTFLGFFAASLDQGKPVQEALRIASAAGALMVTKEGTADAIPSIDDVSVFLSETDMISRR